MEFGILKMVLLQIYLVKVYNIYLKFYTHDDVFICNALQTASKQYQSLVKLFYLFLVRMMTIHIKLI